MTDSPTFDIGLTMAGAVSAGAYTAGVVDFLIQALDAWHEAKRSGAPETPSHAVNLRVLSGASAGAITAAILATHARVAFPPVLPASNPYAPSNPLFSAWVDRIDITELLKHQDLALAARPLSMLDSTIIDQIGDDILRPPPVGSPSPLRPYMAHCLRVLCTLTNATGVPYQYVSRGGQQYSESMVSHGDFMRFAVINSGTGHAEAPRTSTGWSHEYQVDVTGNASLLPLLRQCAIASAAFPLGLRPRELIRDRSDYDHRPVLIPSDDANKGSSVAYIEPRWPPNPPSHYDFVNLDGGCIDNNPFELARAELAGGIGKRNDRDGTKASRAVIMIDPFPSVSSARGPQSEADIPLLTAAFTLLGTYKDHARFNPEELALAQSDDVYSRFLIAPKRSAPGIAGAAADRENPGPWIASGALGGFSGFLSKAYRLHDYFLGRRNCQWFLRKSFSLKIENPLFDGWRNEPWAEEYFIPSSNETSRWVELPIIPLVPALCRQEYEPDWPYNKFSPSSIEGPVASRLDALFQRWIEGEAFVSRLARLTWAVWGRGATTKRVLGEIGKALVAQRLLPGEP